MYADDTLLMSSAKSMQKSVSTCQIMLDSIMSWCDKNKLTVNIKKTKCMFINSDINCANAKLSISGNELEVVKHFQYLEMQIDYKLTMNKQVEVMMKKARCKLMMLYRIRRFISSETSLLIYKVIIRPLGYGDFIITLYISNDVSHETITYSDL